jgi:transposase
MKYRVTTKYVCGIDLHARMLSMCVMSLSGKILLRKSIPCSIEHVLKELHPWICDITVGVESTFNWYWLLDQLEHYKIPCVLGHALYIKRMHSSKHKNDSVDARDIRDLLRRRHSFVRQRAGLYTHLQNTCTQHGYVKSLRNEVHRKSDRRK